MVCHHLTPRFKKSEYAVHHIVYQTHQGYHRARFRVSSVIQPMLSLLSEHTGLRCITLIAGAATPDDPSSRATWLAVHHGQTKDVIPKNFAAYDEDAFKEKFVATFLDYVQEVGLGELPNRFVNQSAPDI